MVGLLHFRAHGSVDILHHLDVEAVLPRGAAIPTHAQLLVPTGTSNPLRNVPGNLIAVRIACLLALP